MRFARRQDMSTETQAKGSIGFPLLAAFFEIGYGEPFGTAGSKRTGFLLAIVT